MYGAGNSLRCDCLDYFKGEMIEMRDEKTKKWKSLITVFDEVGKGRRKYNSIRLTTGEKDFEINPSASVHIKISGEDYGLSLNLEELKKKYPKLKELEIGWEFV